MDKSQIRFFEKAASEGFVKLYEYCYMKKSQIEQLIVSIYRREK